MKKIISSTVSEGSTEMYLTMVPSTPDEIVEHLRENVCVNQRGIRCLPTRVDDEVFDAAANMIERLSGDAHTILMIAKNALQNEVRRFGPLTVGELDQVFQRLKRLGLVTSNESSDS